MDVEQLLHNPIKWKSWSSDATVKAVLDELQPNILKGHGRDHTANLFLRFDPARRREVAEALSWIGQVMAPALMQLIDTEAHQVTDANGQQVTCLVLSAAGYVALGLTPPPDAAFRAGMRGRAAAIGDRPDGQGWDHELAQPLHGMLLVADAAKVEVDKAVGRWQPFLSRHGISVVHVERGLAQKRSFTGSPKPEGVEHFGYVDGRSQPLILAEQVDRETGGKPAVHWDPAFPPSQFLVRDPHGTSDASLGAYFVFRKLEQNVRGFKQREDELAEAMRLGKPPADEEEKERAGALVVGRFENGTPVVLSGEPIAERPPNDFNYDEDPDGKRCPFRGHIRKTNPRGSTGRPDERAHIMARRGITYGWRADGEMDDENDATKPEGGVGLLFMAYMAGIQSQFEFTQNIWANNPNHPKVDAGTDPVISDGPQAPKVPWEDGFGHKAEDFDFRGFVSLKGGEYFFAPCLSVLRRMHELVA